MTEPSLEERANLLAREDIAWDEVQKQARELANALRDKGGAVNNHESLGQGSLPKSLTLLIERCLSSGGTPDPLSLDAVYEILRTGANLCRDEDENRTRLLSEGFPQSVLDLLERYRSKCSPEPPSRPLELTVNDLRVAKTGIGALLNCIVDSDIVRTSLLERNAPQTILFLASSIYPTGSWMTSTTHSTDESESWSLRSGLVSWAWRVVEDFRDNEQDPILGIDALSILSQSISAFIPPYQPSTKFPQVAELKLGLVDLEILDSVVPLLESFVLDVAEARIALAQAYMKATSDEERCLTPFGIILDFIEQGSYPPYLAEEPEVDQTRHKKSMDLCKGALIKVVVEVAGEDRNLDILWDSSADSQCGPFVSRMVKWIKSTSIERDDLLTCATLSLGNLARREDNCVALVQLPHSLTQYLVPLLEPSVDIKLKHGVIGLLKHLAQSTSNRAILGDTGVLAALAKSNVWSTSADMAEVVQGSAIGVAKHLCTGNLPNSIRLMESEEPGTSGLSQILELAKRSDAVAIKSEGARVLVNVVKSVLTAPQTANGVEPTDQLRAARAQIISTRSTGALASLLGRSKKYPLLLHEATLALSLISIDETGAAYVVDALVTQLPLEPSPRPSASNAGSPIVAPPTALDMLLIILKNDDRRFPVELRSQTCSLLGSAGRTAPPEDIHRSMAVTKLRRATQSLLDSLAQSDVATLSGAARKALELWK